MISPSTILLLVVVAQNRFDDYHGLGFREGVKKVYVHTMSDLRMGKHFVKSTSSQTTSGHLVGTR